MTVEELRGDFDAIVLCGGDRAARSESSRPRAQGRPFRDGLPAPNKGCQGDLTSSQITAKGKNVIILGGGDTGADCLGTALRQAPLSVTQLEIMPEPPQTRADSTPWPTWPLMLPLERSRRGRGAKV